MNRCLVELIAQFAIFLETVEAPLEAVVRMQEEMAFQLGTMSDSERDEFLQMLREIAGNERFAEHREILARFPGETGLI